MTGESSESGIRVESSTAVHGTRNVTIGNNTEQCFRSTPTDATPEQPIPLTHAHTCSHPMPIPSIPTHPCQCRRPISSPPAASAPHPGRSPPPHPPPPPPHYQQQQQCSFPPHPPHHSPCLSPYHPHPLVRVPCPFHPHGRPHWPLYRDCRRHPYHHAPCPSPYPSPFPDPCPSPYPYLSPFPFPFLGGRPGCCHGRPPYPCPALCHDPYLVPDPSPYPCHDLDPDLCPYPYPCHAPSRAPGCDCGPALSRAPRAWGCRAGHDLRGGSKRSFAHDGRGACEGGQVQALSIALHTSRLGGGRRRRLGPRALAVAETRGIRGGTPAGERARGR